MTAQGERHPVVCGQAAVLDQSDPPAALQDQLDELVDRIVEDVRVLDVRGRLEQVAEPGTSAQDELARLDSLGATRADVGQDLEVSWTVLADPEGNVFCLLGTGPG